jgi:hypothetical protein
VVLGLASLLGLAAVRADTVYLRNGSTIDGVVLGRHEGHVILQIGNLGKMEIPEKDVLTIEKNARTGPINPDRGDKPKKKDEPNAIEQREKRKRHDGPAPEASPDEEIDPELEEEIQELVYDLTKDRATNRTRAEKRLTELGTVVIPYILPIATNPSELTRIAVFRILKENPDVRAVEAGIAALADENRFVRKLAWETLQEISGESYVFPWDDSSTQHERDTATLRWTEWWKAEKARIEKEEQKSKERRKGE